MICHTCKTEIEDAPAYCRRCMERMEERTERLNAMVMNPPTQHFIRDGAKLIEILYHGEYVEQFIQDLDAQRDPAWAKPMGPGSGGMKMRDIISGPVVFLQRYDDLAGEIRYRLETIWIGKQELLDALKRAIRLVEKPKPISKVN